jgi:hypothetical protein
MATSKKITFRVHGLLHHKDAVDAAVFAKKLSAFVRALSKSDQNGNGRRCLEFLISDLKMGSASASIVERQANTKYPPKASGITAVHATLVSVYGGRASELNGSANLIPAVKTMCSGASRAFSHIEIILDDDDRSAVRVDTFFERQLRTASEQLATEQDKARQKLFRGVSFGSFDGTLKAVDHRGIVKLARLVLTAGGTEIECTYNDQLSVLVRPAFDNRARVEGWAHYDGASALPNRIELKTIQILKEHANLSKWKGAFAIPTDDREDW